MTKTARKFALSICTFAMYAISSSFAAIGDFLYIPLFDANAQ